MVSAVSTNAVSMGVRQLFVYRAFQANDPMALSAHWGFYQKRFFPTKEKLSEEK